jgi:hypothetical protein
VHGRGVLHDHHVIAFRAAEAKLGDRCGPVSQQPFLVGGVGPAAGHDLRPVHRADLGLIAACDLLDEPLGHQPPLGQQHLKRRDPLLDRRHRSGVMALPAHDLSR